MNTPVREGETIEGSRTMRNRPYPVLKCSTRLEHCLNTHKQAPNSNERTRVPARGGAHSPNIETERTAPAVEGAKNCETTVFVAEGSCGPRASRSDAGRETTDDRRLSAVRLNDRRRNRHRRHFDEQRERARRRPAVRAVDAAARDFAREAAQLENGGGREAAAERLVEQQVEVVALDKDRVVVETAMRLDVAVAGLVGEGLAGLPARLAAHVQAASLLLGAAEGVGVANGGGCAATRGVASARRGGLEEGRPELDFIHFIAPPPVPHGVLRGQSCTPRCTAG